jgi:hypothetical protein
VLLHFFRFMACGCSAVQLQIAEINAGTGRVCVIGIESEASK